MDRVSKRSVIILGMVLGCGCRNSANADEAKKRAAAESAVGPTTTGQVAASVSSSGPSREKATQLFQEGDQLIAAGNLDGAKATFEKAREMLLAVEGVGSIDAATCSVRLSFIHLEQGRLVEAESRAQEALLGFRKHLGAEHVLTATPLNNLAKAIEGRDPQRAERLYLEAEAVLLKSGAENDPMLSLIKENLALLRKTNPVSLEGLFARMPSDAKPDAKGNWTSTVARDRSNHWLERNAVGKTVRVEVCAHVQGIERIPGQSELTWQVNFMAQFDPVSIGGRSCDVYLIEGNMFPAGGVDPMGQLGAHMLRMFQTSFGMFLDVSSSSTDFVRHCERRAGRGFVGMILDIEIAHLGIERIPDQKGSGFREAVVVGYSSFLASLSKEVENRCERKEKDQREREGQRAEALRCKACGGSGTKTCRTCSGAGQVYTHGHGIATPCFSCLLGPGSDPANLRGAGKVPCASCGGDGQWVNPGQKCTECNGKGKKKAPPWIQADTVDCTWCKGSGWYSFPNSVEDIFDAPERP